MAAERLAREFVSHSDAATEALGERLGERLEAGTLVALEGELGAGKTCFVRGVARGLGAADAVHSPSFTLMHTYAGRVPVYHFDAWMEGRETAFLQGGGAEWLEAGGVALVEWAERVEGWLPSPRLAVRLAHLAAQRGATEDPGRRAIRIEVVPAQARGGATARSTEEARSLARLLEQLVVPPGVEERTSGAAGSG